MHCPPKPVSDLFKPQFSNHVLGQANFALPSFNTVKYGKRSLKYLGPKLCNKLLNKERSCISLTAFKNCIRKLDLCKLLKWDCQGCHL